MTNRRIASMIALLAGLALAPAAHAQSVQDEDVESALTAQVKAVDGSARTIQIEGANGEAGLIYVDEQTTIMSGSDKRDLSSLHRGDWISIDADTRQGRRVATYIEVVEDPGTARVSTPAEATSTGATVEVRHNSLSPSTIQIAAGQSVTFHNLDKMPGGHTVVAEDGSFTSPPLDEGQSWSHSFDVPGVYPVRIKEHPGAKASIVVE